jgi:hypothetical protein
MSILLTLIALQILNQRCPQTKTEWRMVAQKAKLYIKKQTGKTEKEINAWVDQFTFKLREV